MPVSGSGRAPKLWINPEIDQGFGLSGSVGVAGFPSGEAYKVGADYPYTRLDRAFLRQTINLGGDVQKVDAGQNQFSGRKLRIGWCSPSEKSAVVDIFDTNKYAHDPRSDFMNWSIVDTGTFDYAADAWGYTVRRCGRVVSRSLDLARRRVRPFDRAEYDHPGFAVRTVPVGR